MLSVICGILFMILGAAGGLAAYSRWWRQYADTYLYNWLWGSYLTLAQILTLAGFLQGLGELKERHDTLFMLTTLLVLLGFIGAMFWGFSFVLHMFWRGLSPNFGPAEKSYDLGDGLMVRGRFAEAAALYRQAVLADPADTEGLLRMCRALESAGQPEEAARELEIAYRQTFLNPFSPPLSKPEYQARLLRIVFMLGDLYQQQLRSPELAARLYSGALLELRDYNDAQPLQQRLDAIESGPLTPG